MSRLNRFSRILTLRCEAASELTSRELDETPPRLDRLALVCHIALCNSCRRFRKQLRLIRKAIRHHARFLDEMGQAEGRLSVDARDRIAHACRDLRSGDADAGTNGH